MSGNESNRGISLRITIKQLAEGEIPNPLNGNLLPHQKSFLLQLDRSTVIYKEKVTKKTKGKKLSPELSQIMSLRGFLSRQKRAELQALGLEPCAFSTQEAF
ncbi:MAG: hypothetical protein ACE5OZ_25980 [Candidatus Heimdallarchaeota archaeon]